MSVDIPTQLLDVSVPNLLLQPLVENAIKHGIGQRAAGGTVRVAGERKNGSLYLSVYNDGPSFRKDWETNSGVVGLANLRTRLQILHGSAADLAMAPRGSDGVEVTVSLPLKDA